MSEYPYEGKIHSDDKVNYSTVYSSDGIRIGKVEAAFAESFIVKNEMDNREIKYEIPRLDIVSIISGSITLKLNKKDIDQNYETSSINKI
ncbi:MAG TPA: hypothetical protein VFC05_14120 [Nitrososphaeraceae archaeon]|jgi:hypothetical protein|nr:hypothetical protein [Nitrososphaeraceae archaeon]